MSKSKASVCKFKIKSSSNLINFLKRFVSINKSLLVELSPDDLKAKSHTPDRSNVKQSKIALGDVLEGQVSENLILIGIFDLNKVVNIFKYFSDLDEIFLDVSYDKIANDFIATKLKFYSNKLKIETSCSDPSLYTHISDDMMSRIISKSEDDSKVQFPIQKEIYSKINSLCGFDTTDNILSIKIADNKIYILGKSFEYHLCDITSQENFDFSIYNNQFSYIDQEIASFHLGDNTLLVKSQESDTVITLGRVE